MPSLRMRFKKLLVEKKRDPYRVAPPVTDVIPVCTLGPNDARRLVGRPINSECVLIRVEQQLGNSIHSSAHDLGVLALEVEVDHLETVALLSDPVVVDPNLAVRNFHATI